MQHNTFNKNNLKEKTKKGEKNKTTTNKQTLSARCEIRRMQQNMVEYRHTYYVHALKWTICDVIF